MYNEQLILTLSALMLGTSFLAMESRNLRYASFAYAAQALLMVGIIGAFAVYNHALYYWAAVALITKVFITPYDLLACIKRTGEQESKPLIGLWPSLVIAGIVAYLFYTLMIRHATFLAPTELAEESVFRTNLAAAFTVFVIGLYGIMTRRDAIKTVIGLCLLENGVQLSLVSLAPMVKVTAIAGIATEVVVTVIILLYVIVQIHDKFGSRDTFQLSELHW